jgi:hypothetical protein
MRNHSPSTATANARSRTVCALSIATTIALGLASRRFPILFPVFGKYPGDALWALMVFFGWGLLFPTASRFRVAALTIFTSYTVELLKLYQAPWIVAVRHTTLGHLVFGHVFSWQNLIAYAVGVAMGCTIEATARSNRKMPLRPREGGL